MITLTDDAKHGLCEISGEFWGRFEHFGDLVRVVESVAVQNCWQPLLEKVAEGNTSAALTIGDSAGLKELEGCATGQRHVVDRIVDDRPVTKASSKSVHVYELR